MLFSKAAHPPTFFISTDLLSFFFLNRANLPTQLIFQMTKIVFTYKQTSAFEGERWLVIIHSSTLISSSMDLLGKPREKVVTPTKVQWDAGKIKSTTRESLKQENQETKAQLPLGISFEQKNPRCGLKSKNEAFDRRRLWSRGSWKNLSMLKSIFFRKNIWVSGLWSEKSDYPPWN